MLKFLCVQLVIGFIAATSDVATQAPSLTMKSRLHVEQNFVHENEAERLFQMILEAAVPGPRDTFHPNLIGINGDAGTKLKMGDIELVIKFHDILLNNKENEAKGEERMSGILRIEHVKEVDSVRTQQLINDVVENNVLQEEGTIHLYLSRPDSSALANHTDTTDIFVLQLHGAKEWILCSENEFFPFQEKNLRGKLDGCSTYDDVEMNNLVCYKKVLYPGDAIYLPKRIVHSARATNEGLSAHLTFGFADNTCSEKPQGCFSAAPKSNQERSRSLQEAGCTSAEGGTSCDDDCSFCDTSCDSSCNSSCDFGCCSHCDSSCNSSCDSGCDRGCSSGCDSDCPVSANGGAIAGIVIGSLIFVGAGVLIYYKSRKRKRHADIPVDDPILEGNTRNVALQQTVTIKTIETTTAGSGQQQQQQQQSNRDSNAISDIVPDSPFHDTKRKAKPTAANQSPDHSQGRIRAEATKRRHEKLGVTLKRDAQAGVITVSDIVPDSPFHNTTLKVGMRVISVNGIEITDLDMSLVASILQDSVGQMVFEAVEEDITTSITEDMESEIDSSEPRPQIVATVTKKTADQSLGMTLKGDPRGNFFISGLTPQSPFSIMGLKVGMRVTSINDIEITGQPMDLALTLLKETVGELSVTAEEHSRDLDPKLSTTQTLPSNPPIVYAKTVDEQEIAPNIEEDFYGDGFVEDIPEGAASKEEEIAWL